MQRLLKATLDQLILFVLIIVLIGALLSSNFQNLIQFNLYLGVVAVIGLLLSLFPKIRTTLANSLNRLNHIYVAAILIIAYQCVLIINLSAQFGDDASRVMATAMGKINYYYFAVNPNNLGLLSFERPIYLISQALGISNFLLVLNVVNVILVDVAVSLLILTLRAHLSQKLLWIAVPFCFLLSPWLIVFYTDLAVLPFLAGELWSIHFLITHLNTASRKTLVGVSLAFGFSAYMAYHLKPSAGILTIAVIMELLIALIWPFSKSALGTKLKNRQLLIAIAVILATFGLATGINHTWVSHQHLASVNKNIALQPSHFMLMGLNKESGGRFNGYDYNYSLRYHTAASQNQANFKLIQKRLAHFGIVNLVKFLIVKNYHNTSDGSLGWTNDTQFTEFPSLKHHAFVRSFFYPYGSRQATYFVAAQLVWIGLLIGTLFSFLDRSLFARILRLGTLGILLFLLLFEGGRSRYLIQAFPMIFSLAVIGWTKLRVLLWEHRIIHFDGTRLQTTLRRLILGRP